jgi:HAD superfamily hydrolase (TIGR01549 family)
MYDLLDLHTKYEAIVFDCDGTVVDTMPAHYVAWVRTLQRYGIEFPEDRFYRMGGMSTVTIIDILADEAGKKVDSLQVSIEKENEFLFGISAIQPIGKVVALAEKYKSFLPLGIATGATRKMARLELQQIGVLEWFKFMACSEDVKRHKPHPDVYLAAAAGLGVDPIRCLALDDTDIGLEAAREAGMTVWDVRLL